VLFAFDLLGLDGKDLRRAPLEDRKRALSKLLRKVSWALRFNDHIGEPGDIVFRHVCKLGFEGIVSKRLGLVMDRSAAGVRLPPQAGTLRPPRSSLPPSVPTPAAGAARTSTRARLQT
jgi:hypothetical protein